MGKGFWNPLRFRSLGTRGDGYGPAQRWVPELGNTNNDRLSGYGRNAFIGPDYASVDMRIARKIDLSARCHLELTGESFNLMNRDNQKYLAGENGFYNSAGQFIKYSQSAGGTSYPAYYQQPTSFMKPTSSFAPRQLQLSMRLNF
jgi:hypothetical protein